jgi:hypothetical protein
MNKSTFARTLTRMLLSFYNYLKINFFEKVKIITIGYDRCVRCDVVIGTDDVYFIEFPRDAFCVDCAKKHPDYKR